MYSRNYGSRRLSPPPGYVGNAFSDTEVKHHVPTEEDYDGGIEEEQAENVRTSDVCVKECEKSERFESRAPLEELIKSLRGKLGTEELLILLILLLTSSDGIGIETIILAVALLAGGKKDGDCEGSK